MAKPSQRLIVKDFIKQQAKNLKKHSFVQQMTDFYESRITAAASAQDMLGVKEDILKHIKENIRHLKKVNLRTTAAAVGISLALASVGSVAAVAATAHLMPGAGVVITIIVGLASFVVGSFVASVGKHFFGVQEKYRGRTQEDNNALTTLAHKVQRKIDLTAPQAPDQNPARSTAPQAQAKARPFFDRLRSIFTKSAAKPAPGAAPAVKIPAASPKSSQ
jgi:hypothetical protein